MNRELKYAVLAVGTLLPTLPAVRSSLGSLSALLPKGSAGHLLGCWGSPLKLA